MARLKRTPIFQVREPVAFELATVSLEVLRRAFMPLFDDGAQAIQVAGFEQDDGIIVRRLACRLPDGCEHVVEAASLADADTFVRQIVATLSKEVDIKMMATDVTIVALEVETLLERWVDGDG